MKNSQFTIYNSQFKTALISLCIVHCALCIFFSASAQRPDFKDRNEGDTVIVNKKTYIIHKCKKNETIFTIASQYHVSVNDLDNVNKDVINNLKKNTVLLIPVAKKKEKEEVKKEEEKTISYKDVIYKIALLIPFNGQKNYSFDSTLAGGYALNAELEKETVNNLEFYEGVLTALDSLKKQGFKARITVEDAYDSASLLKAKLKPEVNSADMIMTGLNQNLISLLGNYQVAGKPAVVSCGANTSSFLKGDSTAFFTTPSSLLQCREMGEYYAKNSEAKNRYVMLKTASSKEVERTNAFNNALSDNGDKITDRAFLDTTIKPVKRFSDLMVKGKNNIVFLPTTDEAYVSDIINQLKLHTNEFEITLVGLPTWQYFQSVNPEDLRLLHTTIFSAVYIAYESVPVIAFRKTFRDIYFTEPSEFAFSGYDATMFFGEQMLNHGMYFSEYSDKQYTGLSTDFHFIKENKEGGYENNYISILRFEDYTLRKVNK